MEWLVAANSKKFDHALAFRELPFIDWKQTVDYQEGDTAYIYVCAPLKAVLYECRIEKTNIPSEAVLRDEKY